MEILYIVTGAAGHLGNVITRQLINRGNHVRAFVLMNEKHTPEKAELYFGDVRNQAVYDVNVTGTKNVVDLCIEYNASKLVYVSSVHAIPEKPKGITITEIREFNPDNVTGLYAKTKAEATSYVLDAARKGLNACVVHPSGITGHCDYGRGHITTLVVDYYKGRLTSGVSGGYVL